jgi:hypothetical protein
MEGAVDPDGVGDGLGVGVGVGDGLGVGDGVAVGFAVGLADGLGDDEGPVDGLTDGLTDGLAVGTGVVEGATVGTLVATAEPPLPLHPPNSPATTIAKARFRTTTRLSFSFDICYSDSVALEIATLRYGASLFGEDTRCDRPMQHRLWTSRTRGQQDFA